MEGQRGQSINDATELKKPGSKDCPNDHLLRDLAQIWPTERGRKT
jgi:hypothetical protein